MQPREASRLLRKAVERIRRASIQYNDYFVRLVYQAADIAGVESVFRRIIERDDEMVLDHLMEINFGLLFKSCGFRARVEPTGPEGPDLRVDRDGVSAFVEVKRYRPREAEHIPDSWGPHETLQTYGDLEHTQIRIAADMRRKLRQIGPRDGVEHGILAIWSDRDGFEELEFSYAVRQISPDARSKGLAFCIFGSDYVNVSTKTRYCCEPFGSLAIFDRWMDDLRTT
jgi:hypothetical protein